MTIPWDYDLAYMPPPPEDLRGIYNADAACAMGDATAKLAKRPVDLIMVIDNSGSMQDEIRAVQDNINANLAGILDKTPGGLDYRVILITSFGPWENQMVCIGGPLSNNDCRPRPLGGPPKNGERFFQYDWPIWTNDSFEKLLATYRMPDRWGLAPGGWAGYLRPGSLRVFVEISDDRDNMSEKEFNFRLFVADKSFFLDPKGEKPGFVWHSIVGLKEKVDLKGNLVPYGPKDPFQQRACSNNVWSAGDEFQNESILTGGYRYPICQFMNFNAIFQQFAMVIIEGARLDCEIVVPAAPKKANGDDQLIDYDTLLVEFTPSGGLMQPVVFGKVDNEIACAGAADKFYLRQDKKSIALCPNTCAFVQRDLNNKMRVLYNCIENPG